MIAAPSCSRSVDSSSPTKTFNPMWKHVSVYLLFRWSGRASFELMQKTLVAGIPLLAAVSAPSSLAVQLAQEFNMSLVGFLRGDTFNIYAGKERITE